MSRTAWEPFLIPSCDANPRRFRRFTECRGNNESCEQSEQGAVHEAQVLAARPFMRKIFRLTTIHALWQSHLRPKCSTGNYYR
jgi:hypothetical protein